MCNFTLGHQGSLDFCWFILLTGMLTRQRIIIFLLIVCATIVKGEWQVGRMYFLLLLFPTYLCKDTSLYHPVSPIPANLHLVRHYPITGNRSWWTIRIHRSLLLWQRIGGDVYLSWRRPYSCRANIPFPYIPTSQFECVRISRWSWIMATDIPPWYLMYSSCVEYLPWRPYPSCPWHWR